MIRKSFLRDLDLEQVSIQEWDLPAIGTHQIGFGICPESGLVMQSPSPTLTEMDKYYTETATYCNPGREGKPSDNKVKGLNRLLNVCMDIIGYIPDTIFQVGCSDGYTLNRFKKAGATTAIGIDPSITSHDLSKKLYNIDTIIGTIEDYKVTSSFYELIILTHVLEHISNPLETLKKCNRLQCAGNYVLIEVPLFERMDIFPPGLFTLEHLNYFSEGTMIETVTKSGYEPIFSGKYYNHDEYPVMTVIAVKTNNFEIIKSNDYLRVKELLIDYINKEKQSWKNVENRFKDKVRKGSSAYIYGAGIHTSQLLAYTDLKEHLNILGLLDSSPTKWGKQIWVLTCYNINTIDFKEGDTIIVSSFTSENEIYSSLALLIKNGVNVVRLYN